jgi:hypothetical protein
MVPYLSGSTSTTSRSSCDSTTAGPYNNDGYWSFSVIQKEEEIPVLPKERSHFDRVMKMRNTDGRPVQYSTWKPVRMYNGRDNIGTRNFKKLN